MQLKPILLVVAALATVTGVHAQLSRTDSLKRVANTSTVDTAVIDAQAELASVYRKKNSTDTALLYADQALEGARKIHYKRGEGRALYQKGVLLAGEGKYVDAMRSFDEAASLAESAGDKKTQASALQGFSNQKSFLGDYTGALNYCLQSIEIKRQLGDSVSLGTAYSTLGQIYNASGLYEQGLQAHFAALRINTAAGNAYNMGTDYYNIANAFAQMKKDSVALLYIDKAIALADSIQDPGLKSYPLGLKGKIYFAQKQYALSRTLHEEALAIATEYNDQRLIVAQHMHVGEVLAALNENAAAEQHLLTARDIAREHGLKERLADVYTTMSVFYRQTGNAKKEAESLRLFIEVSDSLQKDKQQNEMTRLEMNYSFEKERELAQAEQEKNDAIYEQDKKRKSLIIYAGAGFLVLVLIFLAFVFNRYRSSQRQKALIAAQKTEVEKQKAVIEEKNKDITDSINYAQRIQSAILPDQQEFSDALPDSFLLYKPKDIVSGDFYWVTQTPQYTFYATADCTGHGVPGGFMSVLGASLLNEIVNEKRLTDPGQVMDTMRERIIGALKQKGVSGENKDGMDMVLCRLDKLSNQLTFAAANNPLWLCRDGKITEYAPDKQPVGIGATDAMKFTSQIIPLLKGDVIYTFTDGYADQFGGSKGKKFKYKPLRELLEANSSSAMMNQHQQLTETFAAWKGQLEQVDDVLLIGVRV